MKKLITLSILSIALFIGINAHAQAYNSAIGLRFGYPTSVSYKKFVSENKAFEGYAGFRSYSFYRAININAALQFHTPIESVEGLKWYWGAGAGLYTYSFDTGFGGDNGGASIAAQGYLGLDYKFESIPLNLSVDWVPSLFIGGYGSGFGADYGALTARYILDK